MIIVVLNGCAAAFAIVSLRKVVLAATNGITEETVFEMIAATVSACMLLLLAGSIR